MSRYADASDRIVDRSRAMRSPRSRSPPAQSPRSRAGAPRRAPCRTTASVPLDRVIAVVNDEALTQYDARRAEARRARADEGVERARRRRADVLEKQVLERLITERALLQFAKETGMRVDDTTVERTILRIARGEQAHAGRVPQGARAREASRTPSIARTSAARSSIQRLREREVDSKIQVSRRRGRQLPRHRRRRRRAARREYLLAHIIVARARAGDARPDRRAAPARRRGARRRSRAARNSRRSPRRSPTRRTRLGRQPRLAHAGAAAVGVRRRRAQSMKKGDVSPVLRSPARLPHRQARSTRAAAMQPTVVEQTHVRHILIKVNEATSEADGQGARSTASATASTAARSSTTWRGSTPRTRRRAKGGDLGWVSPGDTVPEFEQAMNKLEARARSRARCARRSAGT